MDMGKNIYNLNINSKSIVILFGIMVIVLFIDNH